MINPNGSQMHSMLICPKFTTSISLSLEDYIDISNASSKVQFPRKLKVEFWVDIGGEFLHFSRQVLNIFHTFAISYLSKTGFSALAAVEAKYRCMINLENNLRAAISKLQPRYDKLCSETTTSVPLIQV
jgi:hypothetical protein